jgi:TonB-linked SusC/RagA family outer membrane protein
MKSKNKHILAGVFLFSGLTAAHAQTVTTGQADSLAAVAGVTSNRLDLGIRSEKSWRTTGAVFTITGEELSRTNAGNLLNTLQARIPGLTVATGAGEPGYDNPTLYLRGQSSWNVAGNALAIYLDGFQVDLNALSALSPFEIETITLLKDAAAASVYGFNSGGGVVSVRTKEGTASGKTKIELNARYGNLRPIAMPTVMDAYGYVTAYNKALQNDGLPIKYYNPQLYKAGDDPFHPNVNWYDKVLNNSSATQDYNLSFRGGNNKARFFVLGGLTDFKGAYKDADAVDKDFGTNAKFKRINLRANVNVQLNANLSVKATVSGITEDRNTPAGFTASQLFNNLLRLPAAAFPVKNLNGTWGNNSVYNFNPVQLLRQNGVYSSHTRSLQTNISFNQKLDALTKGLSLHGGISYANLYVGILEKKFAVPSYEVTKDAYDNPVIDGSGNITYKVLGSVSQSINDAGNDHWNRNSVQLGFNYDRSFGKHTVTGFLQATRSGYSHDGQLYSVVEQGLRGSVTYDYSQKYVADLSFSYAGSGDFQNGNRYGLFPALGLGWIASNEEFLANNKVISFLKVRGSYGITGNTNEAYRFLYEKWGISGNGIILGTTNTSYGGRTEGAYPNTNFTWEQKRSANIGVDITILKKLNATIDVFTEKRKGILEAPAGVPQYTGFTFRNTNTGEATNKGAEIALQYRDKTKTGFEYYGGASFSYAHNQITRKSQDAQPYDYLYDKGYRIDQFRGLQSAGFYQVADFDAKGNLLPGVVKSTYGQVRAGDLKYVDINGDGLINDYDKTPLKFTKLPEMTLGFNIGFKYAGFDFDAFLQGVMNRTVSLLDDAFDYTHPLANNNNITAFSSNPWTPETAATATSPRLSTLVNNNNNQQADFWLRSGNFFKLRSAELGYTLPAKKFLKRFDILRVYVSGNNLLSTKIDGLEPERLSMGYPLMRTITAGIKAKF